MSDIYIYIYIYIYLTYQQNTPWYLFLYCFSPRQDATSQAQSFHASWTQTPHSFLFQQLGLRKSGTAVGMLGVARYVCSRINSLTFLQSDATAVDFYSASIRCDIGGFC